MAEFQGIDTVIKNLNKKIKEIEGASQKGLTRAALKVRRRAQKKAPIDTGNLKASAYTISGSGKAAAGGSPSFKDDDALTMQEQHDSTLSEALGRAMKEEGPYAEVGFSAVYAWAVHENPRAGQTGGVSPSGRPYKSYAEKGEYKFLEKAFVESEKEILDIIQKEARRGLNK